MLFPKLLCLHVKPVDVKVDVGKQFTNEHKFEVREHMIHWTRIEAAKFPNYDRKVK